MKLAHGPIQMLLLRGMIRTDEALLKPAVIANVINVTPTANHAGCNNFFLDNYFDSSRYSVKNSRSSSLSGRERFVSTGDSYLCCFSSGTNYAFMNKFVLHFKGRVADACNPNLAINPFHRHKLVRCNQLLREQQPCQQAGDVLPAF